LIFAATIDPSSPAFLSDPARGFLGGLSHDLDAETLIAIEAAVLGERLEDGRCSKKPDTAAWHDPLFNGRLCGVHGILDTRLLFLHFSFGGCAYLDDRG
jgi:hypothetical protein